MKMNRYLPIYESYMPYIRIAQLEHIWYKAKWQVEWINHKYKSLKYNNLEHYFPLIKKIITFFKSIRIALYFGVNDFDELFFSIC